MDVTLLAQAITRHIRGVSSAEDDAMVALWRSSDVRNEIIYRQMLDKSLQQQAADRMKQVDSASALKRVYHKAGRSSRSTGFYLIRGAAAAVIIGVISYVITLKQDENFTKAPVATVDRMPGSDRAILVTGSGERVILEGNGDTSLNGMQITQNQGLLRYSAQDNDGMVQIHQLITPKAAKYSMVLPDGSKVWLNAASSLRFPSRFTGGKRQVELDGEGYFEITQDQNSPFTVVVKSTKVNVLGTAFNVRAYSGQVKTTLVNGTVRVSEGEQSKTLKPGELAVSGAGNLKVMEGDISVAAWKDNRFVFHNVPIREVMEELSRWYDVKIIYDRSYLDQETLYNGEISRDVKLGKLVELMEKTGIAKFTLKADVLHVMPYTQH